MTYCISSLVFVVGQELFEKRKLMNLIMNLNYSLTPSTEPPNGHLVEIPAVLKC